MPRLFESYFENADPQGINPTSIDKFSNEIAKRAHIVKAIKLLEDMLTLNPRERITAAAALKHPYVSQYHDPEDEPVFDKRLNWSKLESELSSARWQRLMYAYFI